MWDVTNGTGADLKFDSGNDLEARTREGQVRLLVGAQLHLILSDALTSLCWTLQQTCL